MKRNIAVLSGLLVLMFITGMPVASADPALDQCRAQNSRIHAETMQLFQRARASGRITPAEQQQLAAMEQRLRQFAARLSFGGLTLGECRAMTQALINERNVVARMAATPAGPGPGAGPALAQCRQQNQQIHNETMRLFGQARASGRITPAEQQQLIAMEQRLRQFAQQLSSGGLTLNECRAMTQALINERNVVRQMAASPGPGGGPALAQCRQQNQQIHNETMRLFGQARASGRITPAEQQQLAAMEQRLRQFAQQLASGGLTLNECRAMTQALINERNVVARMAATPAGPGPALAQCRQQNQQIHNETMQLYRRAMAAGRITPQERQQLIALEQRLQRFAQQLSAGGLTLNECRAMTNALINERGIVARMAAR